jgi:hypothetical protein
MGITAEIVVSIWTQDASAASMVFPADMSWSSGNCRIEIRREIPLLTWLRWLKLAVNAKDKDASGWRKAWKGPKDRLESIK